MKKNDINISSVLLALASILLLGALYIWAPVCGKMMCVPVGFTAKILAFIALAICIQDFIYKNNKSYIVIILIALIILTLAYLRGPHYGICKDPMMRCHTTVWYFRASGLLMLASGIINCVNSFKRKK